jgi:hypothetical protein
MGSSAPYGEKRNEYRTNTTSREDDFDWIGSYGWLNLPTRRAIGAFSNGVRSGVMHGILEAVAEDLRLGGGFHLDEAFIDGSFAPAKKGVWAEERLNAAREQKLWR